jgi:type II secretory pathway pseudopilin PulG
MRGHSIIELLLVLTLLGATTASLAPIALEYRDRNSAVAAREAMVGLLAEARLAAMERGLAWVRIDMPAASARVLAPDSTLRTVHFRGDFGTELELTSGADVELRFNALGLGVMAAQTVRFRRGESVAELVVSGYGRVRRR